MMVQLGAIAACLAALLVAFAVGYLFGVKSSLVRVLSKDIPHDPGNGDYDPGEDPDDNPYGATLIDDDATIRVIGEKEEKKTDTPKEEEVTVEEIFRNFKSSEMDTLHENVLKGINAGEGWP